MTATADPPQPAPSRAPTGGSTPDGDVARRLAVCPFLRSDDASWTSAQGSRDLRCWAVRPTVQPSLQKQRQVCVVGGHATCAAYAAAAAPDPAASPVPAAVLTNQDPAISLWPAVSPVPVSLDPVHARPGGVGVKTPRSGSQALLIGLMVVAFVVLAIARTGPLGGSGEGPVSSPAPAAAAPLASAPAAAVLTPAPTPVATPSPAAASPSPIATATPAPSAAPRTYKVRSGDSVASIAAKFHTTVKAIVAANQIVDPRTIHPGQVLIVP